MAKNKTTKAPAEPKGAAALQTGPRMSVAEAEAYKLLRTNLAYTFPEDKKDRVIGLTSSLWDEGKSAAAINLAYAFAEAEKKVLLIEADMRMPVVAGQLGFAAAPGLSDLLSGMNNIAAAVQHYEVSVDERDISFDAIVAGSVPPDPSEMLSSARMLNLLKRLRERYDYVLLDLPPAAAVSDAVAVSHIVDGMVVVVRGEQSVRDGLEEAMRRLRLADANILGFVFSGGTGSATKYYK